MHEYLKIYIPVKIFSQVICYGGVAIDADNSMYVMDTKTRDVASSSNVSDAKSQDGLIILNRLLFNIRELQNTSNDFIINRVFNILKPGAKIRLNDACYKYIYTIDVYRMIDAPILIQSTVCRIVISGFIENIELIRYAKGKN
jgi:hypothetical protein